MKCFRCGHKGKDRHEDIYDYCDYLGKWMKNFRVKMLEKSNMN